MEDKKDFQKSLDERLEMLRKLENEEKRILEQEEMIRKKYEIWKREKMTQKLGTTEEEEQLKIMMEKLSGMLSSTTRESVPSISEKFEQSLDKVENTGESCAKAGQELVRIYEQELVGKNPSHRNEARFYHHALHKLCDRVTQICKERYHNIQYQSTNKTDTYAYVLRFFMDVESELLQFKINKGIIMLKGSPFQGCNSATTEGRVGKNENTLNFYKYVWSDCLNSLKERMEKFWNYYNNEKFQENLVHCAFLVIAFRHSNTILEQSGKWAFGIQDEYPDIYDLHMVDWIFKFFLFLERNPLSAVDDHPEILNDVKHYREMISTLNFPLPAPS